MSSCVHATYQLLFFTQLLSCAYALQNVCIYYLQNHAYLFSFLAVSASVLNSGLDDNMQCLS